MREELREDVRQKQPRQDQRSGVAEGVGRFPYAALLAWALVAFLVPSFAQALDLVDVFAFPLGFFMTAQGALLAFLVIGALSAHWQDRRAARRTSVH